MIAEFRERLAQIGDVIDTESQFISAFAPLTQSADDQLKLLVKKAFEEVFNCEVIDLDEGLADDEPKTLDLLVRYGDWRCFVEVRSSGNRGAHKKEIEDMDEHVPAVAAKHGSPDSKLFVYNGLYNRSMEERTDKKMFNQPVVDEAELRGTTLISTFRLLQAIDARRSEEITDMQFIEALKMPGVFEPPWCQQ